MKRIAKGPRLFLCLTALSSSVAAALALDPGSAGIRDIPSVRIWDGARHCAFTDLIRFKGRFLCTFREGSGHVPGKNGVVRILSSTNGRAWESLALLEEDGIDLRDPKLAVMPDGSLMMNCGGSDYSDGLQERFTRVAFSTDGIIWTKPQRVKGIPSSNWFFRITWKDGIGYCMPSIFQNSPENGRVITAPARLHLYKTLDGLSYQQVSEDLNQVNELQPGSCEATIRFREDGELVAIIRGEGAHPRKGFLLHAKAPYTKYEKAVLHRSLGGPNMIELGDGSWLVGTREKARERPEGRSGNAMVLLHVQNDGSHTRLAELPSGGDCSYPGLCLHEGELWVSYYSSHEENTAIYLSHIPLGELVGDELATGVASGP